MTHDAQGLVGVSPCQGGHEDLLEGPLTEAQPHPASPSEAALALIPPRRDATSLWYAAGAQGWFLPA